MMKKLSKSEKIRKQYFNHMICLFLSFAPTAPIMLFFLELRANEQLPFDDILSLFWENLPIVTAIWNTVLIPLVLLSLLNRFCFGSVICVLDDQGVHIDNDLIPWTNIKGISFQPAMHSKFMYRPACATFLIKGEEEYELEVTHFPFYALWKMKRYCPDVKIVIHDKEMVIFLALLPTIVSIVSSLLS